MGLEVPGHHRGALVGAGRAPVGRERDAQHEHAAVGHRGQLLGELHGLRPRLPRVQDLVLVLGEPLDLLPLEVHPGRDDEAVVLEVPLAEAHPLLIGLDGGGRLVDDPHPVLAQAVVAHRERVDRAHAGQDQVAERAGDELPVGLDQDHLDVRVEQAHVLGRRRPAPAAADHDDARALLGGEVALDRGGASGEAGAGQHAESEAGGPQECPSRDHAHRVPSLPWCRLEILNSRPGSTRIYRGAPDLSSQASISSGRSR